jgi:hypothetical protein
MGGLGFGNPSPQLLILLASGHNAAIIRPGRASQGHHHGSVVAFELLLCVSLLIARKVTRITCNGFADLVLGVRNRIYL